MMAYGGKLLWQNVYYIPYALMKKQLRFAELSVIRMLANLAEFIGKVTVAALGFGIWCYVAGPLCRVLVTGIGVQSRYPWRPRFVLRLRATWGWVVFGVKASAYKILFYLYTNVDYHVVGYFFGEHASGLYYNAYLIVLEPCRFISEVVQNIAFPVFSRLKHDRPALVAQFTQLTRMNLVVILGFLCAVFVGAEDLLLVALGAEWTPAAPAVQILCAVGVLRALSFVVPPLLDGTGYPGRSLIYTVVAAIVLPTLFFGSALVLGDTLGYLSVAWAWAVGYPIAFLVLLLMALAVLRLRFAEYVRRTVGIFVASGLAGGCGAALSQFADAWPAALRLAAEMGLTVVVFGALLARFEGITPRAVARSLRE
jgi:O-antigen/teichoic acid export membrane protein